MVTAELARTEQLVSSSTKVPLLGPNCSWGGGGVARDTPSGPQRRCMLLGVRAVAFKANGRSEDTNQTQGAQRARKSPEGGHLEFRRGCEEHSGLHVKIGLTEGDFASLGDTEGGAQVKGQRKGPNDKGGVCGEQVLRHNNGSDWHEYSRRTAIHVVLKGERAPDPDVREQIEPLKLW